MNLFLLKSAGVIALFLIIYKLFLERDTYFKGIRVYFILGIVASIVVPFISITKYIEAQQTQQFVYSPNFQNFISANEATPFNWSAFLFAIYITGIALSGLYFVIQIISLAKILNTKSVKKFNNYTIIETQKEVSPFSFFKFVVYNPKQFNEAEIKQLLKHEETHVLQKHSIDMLLAHLLTCVQWFNPFAWYYKKAITQNLEYIADKEAKYTIAPKNYSYLLLKTTSSNYQMAIANNFYNSLLKKRIMMLHKNHSPRLKQFKLALILPLLVGFVFAFNTKVVAQYKNNVKEVKANSTNFSVIINKNINKSNLDFVKTRFAKFGFNLKISNVKRNAKNEIIRIKISAKKEYKIAQYASKGNKPILPIIISYNDKSDNVSIGANSNMENNLKNSYNYVITSISKDSVDLDKMNNKVSDFLDKYIIVTDSTHSVKLKNNGGVTTIISSNNDGKDKDKEHASFFTKPKNNVSAVWIDDDGNSTDIIEVKKDGKKYKIIKNNSKSTWKDKDGNIIKVIAIKTDKNGNISKIIETVKVPEEIEVIDLKANSKPTKLKMSFKVDKNGDIDASNHKKGFYFNTGDDNPPIFVIDGKIMKKENMKKLDPKSIKSINVLKGEKATKKYGKKGKNGVIEITTKIIKVDSDKKGTKFIIKRIDDDKIIDLDNSNNKNIFVLKTSDGTSPIFVIDGKEIKKEKFEKINPNTIKSINVIKGEKATKKYGVKGKNGVIEITTKKEDKD